MNADDISPPNAPAWKPEIGDTIRGTIMWEGELETAAYKDETRTERKLKVVLDTDSGEFAIWATISTNADGTGYSKRDAQAIANAVRAAGVRDLEAGGVLEMTRIADVQTKRGPAKAYTAVYEPPQELPGALAKLTA